MSLSTAEWFRGEQPDCRIHSGMPRVERGCPPLNTLAEAKK